MTCDSIRTKYAHFPRQFCSCFTAFPSPARTIAFFPFVFTVFMSTYSNLVFTKSSLIHSVQHPFKLSSTCHTIASSAVALQTFPIISGRREREKVYRKYIITSFEYGIIDCKTEKQKGERGKSEKKTRTWKNFFLHSKKFNTRYISFPSSGLRLYHPRTATRLKGRRESVWKMNWKWKASFFCLFGVAEMRNSWHDRESTEKYW